MTRRKQGAPRLTRVGAAAAVALLAVLGAGPALGAPNGSGSVESRLINEVAAVDQNIADLDNAVAVRQEKVNKALVDYQNSLAAEQLANAAARTASKQLGEAAAAVEQAQASFDEVVRSVSRQGVSQGSMANYVSSDDPQGVLDRLTVLDRLAREQQATVKRLQVARNQQANRVAAAEATRRQATFATKSAAGRKDDALTSVSAAREALKTEQKRRSTLLDKREEVQRKLDELRGTAKRDADGPALPTDPVRDFVDALPPGIPAAGGDDALRLAAEAAAKLAVDVGQQLLAGLIGQQQMPRSELLDELGLGGATIFGEGDTLSSRLGSGSLGSLFGSSGGGGGGPVRPGLRGAQAVEIVVNRALSQLNVQYAWGGGDANGPTQGIRDGGVADSYGDYNKIGFDCSGLMIYAFAGVGIELPHYTGYQYTSGPQVPLSQIQRGDMIFYGPSASQHVALYLGDNKMVEAPQSGDVVKVSPLRTAGAMPMVVRLL